MIRVAKVIDQYTVALNAGKYPWGIREGDIFVIGSDPILDPETGQDLGVYSKLRVKVTEVYEKFCIAETYRITTDTTVTTVTVNIGDSARKFHLES